MYPIYRTRIDRKNYKGSVLYMSNDKGASNEQIVLKIKSKEDVIENMLFYGNRIKALFIKWQCVTRDLQRLKI